jgi:hypothetical protein
LAQHGALEVPEEFDLDYLQLASDSARLKLRMGDSQGAVELIDAALAHLEKHAGQSNFAFMRRELQQVREAAGRASE